MIRRVRVAQWRAYEQLDLQLRAPVTFVVAPNGVGKTSLVEAVRWALLGGSATGLRGVGEADDRHGAAVRLGAGEATVELDLDLGGEPVRVTRTLHVTGGTSFRATRAGTELAEADYGRLLAESWSAEPAVLRSLLFGEAGTHTSSPFPIRDHLAQVFGLAPIDAALDTIDERLRVLRGEIRDRRAGESADAEARQAAERRVEELQTAAAAAAAALADATDRADRAAEDERAAAAWQRHRADLARYQRQVGALGERLSAVVDELDGEPQAVLARTEELATAELDRRRDAVTAAQVQAATAAAALDLLGEAGGRCPTCLRSLSGAARARALDHHLANHDEAGEVLRAGQDALRAAEERLAQVRDIIGSLRAVRVPAPPDFADPGPDAAEAHRAARRALRAAAEAHGAALARGHDARRELDARRRAAGEHAALVAAYREEALLQVHHQALREVADRYLAERIEPLAEEVASRWKLVFGSEGLRFDPDGSIRLRIDEGDLRLTDLSGGERVVALFVTRLLAVASATRATTVWLDEPLEHLDPRRRGALAGTIVRAVQQGALDQIVVTTYEERLARQLAATAPGVVGIAHVRANPRHR